MRNKTVVASLCLANALSLNIYELDASSEKVLVGYSCDALNPRWHKLYYTNAGECYFKMRSKRYQLDQFM